MGSRGLSIGSLVLFAACETRLARESPHTTTEARADPPGAATTLAPAPPIAKPAAPRRRPGAWANIDPDDDGIVGPPGALADCESELEKAGVKFAKATLAVRDIKTKRAKLTCGAPQVVTYQKGPGKITYNAPPLLTCTMALALASFERLAQDEAMTIFKSPIARIDQLGTYNCREMAAYPGWASEHSYANAIDIARFMLADGRTIDIERDFDLGTGEPKKPGGIFLRVVSRRANDEDVFSHVLTPFWDSLHKNHFHLDLARYRTDGTRPHG